MVHLTYKGTPLCEHTCAIRCQYSTRREAFDMLVKRFRKTLDRYNIAPGGCPHMNDGNQQGGRV